jgi:hypothetical protein
MVRLFAEGKKKGLFDPRTDEILIAHMAIGTIRHILDPKILPNLNYSLDRLFNSVTAVILKGCLTEEGRKLAYPDRSASEDQP